MLQPTTSKIILSRDEARKWEIGPKIILNAINHHRDQFLNSSTFPTTGKVHGNICPQTVGTSITIRKGSPSTVNMVESAYLPDPTSRPFNLAFQSTAWLQHALDIKSINHNHNFADNIDRLEALNLCIKNAKSVNNATTTPLSAQPQASARAVTAHGALLIPTTYVDDLESFIFVLADFCMRNSNTFRRFSESPTIPKWISDPVSHAALIEKERILEHGICAWEHEPAELFVFAKLFEDLARHLKRARDAEQMYRTIDEAVRNYYLGDTHLSDVDALDKPDADNSPVHVHTTKR
ncbi:hypothetical protein M413DRAFT_416159 [Hebeloma cylindrosporum]|uniref:Uncharacterized protein n=1 Tax=Hebeloma cylindrosporum TaxID=76867 RepID=A0A0C3CTK4_HEBCY|nr:hypothetical protein M413DRAFT_416159 [Hebeloma cylindrosporum h7]